jgi:hypothetical protein
MNRAAFLFASWYSGATLLTLLLDAHPEIVSNGEAFPFGTGTREYRCTCGLDIRECPFYREAAAHMRSGDRFDPAVFIRTPKYELPPLLRRFARSRRVPLWVRSRALALVPAVRRHDRAFVEAHVEFMRRACTLAGARVYLDATKSLRRAELLAGHLTVPVDYLLLVKDCRAYVDSYLRRSKWPESRAGEVARDWRDYIAGAGRVVQAAGGTLRVVRFEDLCLDPDGTMRDIFDMLHVATDAKPGADPHQPHLTGNEMRHRFDGRIERREERWKATLSGDAVRTVTRIAGPTMRELGYA